MSAGFTNQARDVLSVRADKRTRPARGPLLLTRLATWIRDTGDLLWAIVFAALMHLMDWPALQTRVLGRPMADLQNYAYTIQRYADGAKPRAWTGLQSYTSDEFLWHHLLALLGKLPSTDPSTALSWISFFITFTSALLVVRQTESPALTLLLVNPFFIDLAYSQLRLGLAIATVTWAFFLLKERLLLSVLFAAVAMGIHTSAALFSALAFATNHWPANPDLSGPSSYARLALLSGATALALGPLRSTALTVLDDRRQGGNYLPVSASMIIFWLAVALVLTVRWHEVRKNAAARYGLGLLLVSLLGDLLGGYNHRTLSVAQPFAIVGVQSTSATWSRAGLIYLWVVYTYFYWDVRLPFWEALF